MTGLNDISNLLLHTTGTVAATTASFSGSGDSYTLTLGGISGDGRLGVQIDRREVQDMAGNQLDSSVTSARVVIDNTAPTIAIDTPIGNNGMIVVEDLESGVILSGTSSGLEVGQIVYLTLTDPGANTAQGAAVVASDGTWQFTLDQAGLHRDLEMSEQELQSGDPRVATLADGGWGITWWDRVRVGNTYDRFIYQQRFEADGSTSGLPEVVWSGGIDFHDDLDIAALADGGWIVAWHDRGASPISESDDVILFQRYDAAGASVGSLATAATGLAYPRHHSEIAALPDGGWLIVWAGEGDGSDGDDRENYQLRYDAAGAADPAGVVKVDDADAGMDLNPAVAVLPDGGWVIIWAGEEEANNWNVFSKRYDGDGVATTAEVLVAAEGGATLEPRVAALGGGGWVLSWLSIPEAEVRYEQYDSAGQRVASGSANTTGKASRSHFELTGIADGGYVITWGVQQADRDVYLQQFASDGTPIGGNVMIEEADDNYDDRPAISPLRDGGWIITWHGEHHGLLSQNIFYQRFASDAQVADGVVGIGDFGDGYLQIEVSAGDVAGNQSDAMVGAGHADQVRLESHYATYIAWAEGAGLTLGVNSGLEDDPDGDGLDNLEEFAYGGDPLMGNEPNRIVVSTFEHLDGEKHGILVVPARQGAQFIGTAELVARIDGITYRVSLLEDP